MAGADNVGIEIMSANFNTLLGQKIRRAVDDEWT